jgi:hypothetical protein
MTRQREDMKEAFDALRRLRYVDGAVEPDLRPHLTGAIEFLEDTVGPTIRPAEAARRIGISQPALHRWMAEGEIPTVLTPDGRREIPVPEFVELLDEVDRKREEGRERPLAAAIRERRERAMKDIDLDRVIPRRRKRGHRTAELQSLAYHRVVADRLDEKLIEKARRRLARWRATDRIHPRWAAEWERLLERSPSQIARVISADTPRARELRQTSPFAGVLTAQERSLLTRAVEERA